MNPARSAPRSACLRLSTNIWKPGTSDINQWECAVYVLRAHPVLTETRTNPLKMANPNVQIHTDYNFESVAVGV